MNSPSLQGRCPPGVMAFPAEVLLIILRLVHAPLMEGTPFLVRLRRPPLHSPKLFPYCVGNVCKTWDFVASMAPEFWSLVVIFLDSTPLEYAKELLKRSKDLPIEIHILANKPLDQMDPPTSFTPDRIARRKLKMQQLVAAIVPHLHRCEILVIQVAICDLLPRLIDIQAPAPKLTRLILEARHHKHPHPPLNSHHIQPILLTPPPKLDELYIDGLDWYPWFQSQLDTTGFRNLFMLTISNLNLSRPGQSTFDTLDEFATGLGTMETLSNLTLINVSAEDYVSRPLNQRVELRSLGILELVDCEAPFLSSFFAFVDILPMVDDFIITRCPIDAIPDALGSGLTLEGIDALNDLGGFLKKWDGGSITIKDCPAFGNHALMTLSGNRHRPPSHEFLFALEIWNSFGFTLEVLQNFVQIRTELPTDGQFSEFSSLIVKGAPYDLSSDDYAWFNARLEDFSWTTVCFNVLSCRIARFSTSSL